MIAVDRFIHRLIIPLTFPTGLAPGAGKEGGNLLLLACDGLGRPILRGTALAGALRHGWAGLHQGVSTYPLDPDPALARWFGHALSGDGQHAQDRPSPLRVSDVVLGVGCSARQSRHHNSIDRHTGAVRDKGLFSIVVLPPGTAGTACLTLHLSDAQDDAEAPAFLGELLGLLESGLVLGGHGARGIGRAALAGTALHRRFDLKDLDQHRAWLDASWAARDPAAGPPTEGQPLEAGKSEDLLRITCRLAIPRGQDICVGDGAGLDYTIEPQRVVTASGEERWRLPGSTLRGVIRAWMTRLAVRDGASVCDSNEHFEARARTPATGDDIAWGFCDPTLQKDTKRNTRIDRLNRLDQHPDQVDTVISCPIMRLFGSLYHAGRIHIADALSDQPIGDNPPTQHRKHVAIDSITGGASEGMLFDHNALMRGPVFTVTITVRRPQEHEARHLAASLRAIDSGLIRIGSSKSAGRLALAGSPTADGPHAHLFTSLVPCEV
jgi:CRISPR/Cas system CSM-associated protein Csm3 (group 7 of RAMP superfamily)